MKKLMEGWAARKTRKRSREDETTREKEQDDKNVRTRVETESLVKRARRKFEQQGPALTPKPDCDYNAWMQRRSSTGTAGRDHHEGASNGDDILAKKEGSVLATELTRKENLGSSVDNSEIGSILKRKKNI